MTSSQLNKQQLLQQVWQAIRSRDLKQAISASNQLNGNFPDFAAGWHASSHLARLINQPRKALLAIDRALKIESGQADWHLHRAACLLKCGEIETARKLLETFAADPADRGLHTAVQLSQLAFLCNQASMLDSAAALYLKLTSMEPENGGHWYNLATIQRFKGDLTQAEVSLEKAIALNSADYEAYELRSDLRQQTKESNHVEQLEKLLLDGISMPAGEVRVCYALAKECEDLGETERSFEVLKRGADLRRKHLKYSIDHDLETMASLQSVFERSLFDKPARGHDSAEPIFIIGLPRTGTTLAERILGNHSAVFAAGELNNFSTQMMQQLRQLSGGQNLSRQDLVRKSAGLDSGRLGKAYIDSTRPLTGHTQHFIDKLPLNYLNIGLIHLALPRARIIHLTRHPMDSCYSIYKRLFQDGYPWSYDIKEIARYYLAYQSLMAHWKSVLPGVIHDLAYEDLVEDIEAAARKMMDFCDLPWEEQCLRFHESSASSTTASASQVRKQIYSSSVGRWRCYEQQLAPLAAILEQGGIQFDA